MRSLSLKKREKLDQLLIKVDFFDLVYSLQQRIEEFERALNRLPDRQRAQLLNVLDSLVTGCKGIFYGDTDSIRQRLTGLEKMLHDNRKRIINVELVELRKVVEMELPPGAIGDKEYIKAKMLQIAKGLVGSIDDDKLEEIRSRFQQIKEEAYRFIASALLPQINADLDMLQGRQEHPAFQSRLLGLRNPPFDIEAMALLRNEVKAAIKQYKAKEEVRQALQEIRQDIAGLTLESPMVTGIQEEIKSLEMRIQGGDDSNLLEGCRRIKDKVRVIIALEQSTEKLLEELEGYKQRASRLDGKAIFAGIRDFVQNYPLEDISWLRKLLVGGIPVFCLSALLEGLRDNQGLIIKNNGYMVINYECARRLYDLFVELSQEVPGSFGDSVGEAVWIRSFLYGLTLNIYLQTPAPNLLQDILVPQKLLRVLKLLGPTLGKVIQSAPVPVRVEMFDRPQEDREGYARRSNLNEPIGINVARWPLVIDGEHNVIHELTHWVSYYKLSLESWYQIALVSGFAGIMNDDGQFITLDTLFDNFKAGTDQREALRRFFLNVEPWNWVIRHQGQLADYMDIESQRRFEISGLIKREAGGCLLKARGENGEPLDIKVKDDNEGSHLFVSPNEVVATVAALFLLYGSYGGRISNKLSERYGESGREINIEDILPLLEPMLGVGEDTQALEDAAYLNANQPDEMFENLRKVQNERPLKEEERGRINDLLDKAVVDAMLAGQVRAGLRVWVIYDSNWQELGAQDPAVCDGYDIFIRESTLGEANFEEVFIHEVVARHLGNRQAIAQGQGDVQHIGARLAEKFMLENNLMELKNNVNAKPEEIASLQVRIDALEQDIRQLEQAVSARKEANQSAQSKEDRGFGGIDLTPITGTMKIIPTPALNSLLQAPGFALQAQQLNIDEARSQLQNMVNGEIIPSSDRFVEYAYALSQKGQLQDNLDALLTCLAEVMRLEEDEVIHTDAALKELLVVLESEKPTQSLQLALASHQ